MGKQIRVPFILLSKLFGRPFISVFLFLLAALMLGACKTAPTDIRQEAEQALRNSALNRAHDANQLRIGNIATLFSTDDACVLGFVATSNDTDGKDVVEHIEFIYCKVAGDVFSTMYKSSQRETLMQEAANDLSPLAVFTPVWEQMSETEK